MAPRVARATIRGRSIHTVRALLGGETRTQAEWRAVRSQESTDVATTLGSCRRRAVPHGSGAVAQVDADSREKKPPFDHARLAASLSVATGTADTVWAVPDPCALGFPLAPKVHMTRHG